MGVVSLTRKTVKVQFKSTFFKWQVEKSIKLSVSDPLEKHHATT